MRIISHWSLAAVLFAAAPLFAQTGSTAAAPCKCTPRPYSATFKTTTVRTLADGTTITQVTTEAQARDSASRQMNSTTRDHLGSMQDPVTNGDARDPVAGTQITWNSINREATVLQILPANEHQGCWADDSGHLREIYHPYIPHPASRPRTPAQHAGGGGGGGGGGAGAASVIPATGVLHHYASQHEDLGTSTIMGVEVHGTRDTITTPAGAIGNDRPIVRTMENWVAPSLGAVLRSITDDPQSGNTTREIETLDLGEPPISMFQPPEGYKVITQHLHQIDCPQRQ